LAWICVCEPRTFRAGSSFDRTRWSYLRGEWRDHGWWYYYLYGAAIKIPLGTWLLFLLAGYTLIQTRWTRSRAADELVVLLPALAIVVLVSSQLGLNKHFRYVLPALPFVFVWVSRVATARMGRWFGALVIVGVTSTIVSSLWIYPHSLSYFNETIGGPLHGHRHLVSSNIDWGQDLLFLRKWAQRHPEARPLRIAYNLHLVNPTALGFEAAPKPPGFAPRSTTGPPPGWYAVDITHLTAQDGAYQCYERWPPIAYAGYSFRIYHVTPEAAERVRAQLALPPGAR